MRPAVRAGRLVSGIATGLVVFVAVPVVLVALVGVPVPHGANGGDRFHLALDALAIVAWLSWAVCCWPILRDVVARVRRRDAAPGVDARWRDRVSARIAGAVLVVVPLGLLATGAGAATSAAPPAAITAAALTAPDTSPAGGGPAGAAIPAPPTASTGGTYVVAPGDSLWSIAEHLFDDGADWQELAALNLGRVMDDGRRFVDPSLIYAGWQLELPGDGGAAPSTASATSPSTAPAPASTPPVVTDGPPEPTPAAVATRVPPVAVPAAEGSSAHRRAPAAEGARRTMPELAVLGIGVVAAALLARRVRRARRLGAATRRPGSAPRRPTDEEAALEGSLLPFAAAPVVDWLEVADRHLGWALDGHGGPVPAVRALRAGPDGVEAWLAGPARWAPPQWSLAPSGRRWLLGADADLDALAGEADGAAPWLPALAVVGTDEKGTWALALEPGDCVPVVGAGADDALRALSASLAGWSWSEQVHVTADGDEAERLGALVGAADDDTERTRVVFVGDPSALSAVTLARCAVLTGSPVPASGLTVALDGTRTTLEPLGVALVPDLLGSADEARIDHVLAASSGEMAPSAAGEAESEPEWGAQDLDSVGGLSAGPVEARLLTAVPRLDGLCGPLDPKRARRAVELVAYLALHAPDPVTSDRLRTRVLGSGESDAAAKTLFNTAGAARKALGTGPEGAPLLPAASKTGQYRIDGRVSVDVERLRTLLAAAARQTGAEARMALGRAALDLIEGEPLATVLSGYGWWRAEGHEARLAATVVDGACALAEVAGEAGRFELGTWAIDQARLVDPYSEALTRAAMTLAALAEDTDQLRREWNECLRRTDELDPGGYPSQQTERLFGELSRPAAAAG